MDERTKSHGDVLQNDGRYPSCKVQPQARTEIQYAAVLVHRQGSQQSMVIGTSAIVDTEIDGAVGMNSGIFNNPFIIWGKYHHNFLKTMLTISFQFHHTQMDGAHAGRFLANLQKEINNLR